jgi:uncharacterized protein YggE
LLPFSSHRVRLAATILALTAVALAGIVWLDPGTLRAGGAAPPNQPRQVVEVQRSGITVLGDGMARAEPDTFTVRFCIQTTAKSPAEALFQAREATELLVQLLRDRDVPERDLQTSDLVVFPIQAPPKNGSPEPWAITGYQGNATVTLQVDDPRKLNALLTAALPAGVTSVHGISYGLRDESDLRRQALQAALSDARPKAEAMAAAAGLTVTGVRTVVEEPFGQPRPLGGGGRGSGLAVIAPGELAVAVRVSVTYDVQ